MKINKVEYPEIEAVTDWKRWVEKLIGYNEWILKYKEQHYKKREETIIKQMLKELKS